jgi:hypothetical protein
MRGQNTSCHYVSDIVAEGKCNISTNDNLVDMMTKPFFLPNLSFTDLGWYNRLAQVVVWHQQKKLLLLEDC